MAYVTDLQESAALSDAMTSRLHAMYAELGREGLPPIEIRQGDYSFAELREWRDKSSDDLFANPDVVGLDLNEGTNRIQVDFADGSGRTDARLLLESLGVPPRATDFVVTGPFAPHAQSQTLRDHRRPIEGGLRIRTVQHIIPFGFVGCTAAFTAYKSGAYYLFTASHCSPIQWQVDSESWYQVLQNDPTHLIGQEAIDPLWFPCGQWWNPFNPPRICQYADAAGIQLTTSDYKFSFLSRPQGRGSGSVVIDPVNPRIQIVGEIATVPQGWTVDAIGMTTGWKYGQVTQTCKSVADATYRWLCQQKATYTDSIGDSGGPVFVWNGSTAKLAGIHVGQQGGEAVFSSMGQIQQRVGPLTTYYSVAISGPTEVTTPGTYTWEAFPSPGAGSHSYQWSVHYFDSGTTQNLGTAKTQQLFVTDFGHFEMRVTSTLGGASTSDVHFVNNNIGGGPEEAPGNDRNGNR